MLHLEVMVWSMDREVLDTCTRRVFKYAHVVTLLLARVHDCCLKEHSLLKV